MGFAIVGLDGRFLKVNAHLAAELQRECDDVLNFRFQDLTHVEDLPTNLLHLERVFRGEAAGFEMEKRYYDVHGDPFWTQLNVSLVNDASGQPEYFATVVQNIDARKSRENHLRSLAYRDALTGLANRAGFEAQATAVVEDAHRRNRQCALVLIDLNGLKAVNDRWGHSAGDLVISTSAARLKKVLEGRGVAGRLGGDEFAAVVSPVCLNLLDDIRNALERPLVHENSLIPISASVGLALLGEDGKSVMDLLRVADARMYSHKKELQKQTPGLLRRGREMRRLHR